jgi:energy-coupling factor transporter transmembrane protein EcfT
LEVLFHFIFQLFKIAILSTVYALVVYTLLVLIAIVTNSELLKRIEARKLMSILKLWVLIAAGLFVYSFSYWGNHGLGDSARIPIGYGNVVSNINWIEYGTLDNQKTNGGKKIHTTKFKVTGSKLSGNLDSFFYDYKNNYFVFDMETNEFTEFTSVAEFDQYATQNNLPQSSELLSFHENYYNHWGGIRMLLLP